MTDSIRLADKDSITPEIVVTTVDNILTEHFGPVLEEDTLVALTSSFHNALLVMDREQDMIFIMDPEEGDTQFHSAHVKILSEPDSETGTFATISLHTHYLEDQEGTHIDTPRRELASGITLHAIRRDDETFNFVTDIYDVHLPDKLQARLGIDVMVQPELIRHINIGFREPRQEDLKEIVLLIRCLESGSSHKKGSPIAGDYNLGVNGVLDMEVQYSKLTQRRAEN